MGQNFASSAYGNCRDLLHALNVLFMQKVNFEKKIQYFPLRSFCVLHNSGIPYRYNTLLPNFCSIICQVVGYGRFKKTKHNFKLLALKVVAGHLQEVVTYKRFQI